MTKKVEPRSEKMDRVKMRDSSDSYFHHRPPTPPALLHFTTRSNNSVNNAITNAPPRRDFLEPNVYVRGREVRGRRGQREDYNGILTRIDMSIRTKFGDWATLDEEEFGRPQRKKKQPSPPVQLVDPEKKCAKRVNLPALYKSYDMVSDTGRNSEPIGLSRDNDDPNSILSQAKMTLTQVQPMLRKDHQNLSYSSFTPYS